MNNSKLLIQAILICILVAVFYCYEYFLRVAPSVISADLMQHYQISHAGLGILSACFYYAYTPLQIPVGLLMDKYGPRIMLTVACLLCAIGTYQFGASASLFSAQVGRFLVGFGSAFAFVGFLKISSNWLPRSLYAMMVGFCMLLGTFGAMGGEIIVAELLETMNWQKILQISSIIGLIITVILWLFVRNEPCKSLMGPSQPENKDTCDHNTIPLFNALTKIIMTPQLWIAGLIGCFTYLPLSSFAEMWAVPYLESIGYSKSDAATGSSLIFLGFGIGGPLWGIFSDMINSRKKPLVIGSLLAAISACIIILLPNIAKLYMFIALFCCGLFSSAEIIVFAVGNDTSHKSISGTTVAFINMTVMIGGIILQPVIGKILDLKISTELYDSYQIALSALPIGLFLSAILSLILKETYTKAQTN